jgi:hypothetical protein
MSMLQRIIENTRSFDIYVDDYKGHPLHLSLSWSVQLQTWKVQYVWDWRTESKHFDSVDSAIKTYLEERKSLIDMCTNDHLVYHEHSRE